MRKQPLSKADRLADQHIRHYVRVIRSARRVEEEVAGKILNGLERKIIVDLVTAQVDEPKRMGDRKNRADKVVTEVGRDARSAMRSALKTAAGGAAEIIAADQIATARILSGAGLQVRVASDAVISRIIQETVISGAGVADWWSRQAQTVQRSFADQVNQGLREGEPLSEIVKRVRGTPGGPRGIINEARRREAETLVRTSIQSQLGGVRREMFRQNADVIRASQVLTAFDSKVCPQCAAFSGGVYDEDGKPLPESAVQVALPFETPPLHPNCRCLLIPVLDDEPAAQDVEFGDWLKEQPVKVQREVLGATRQRLWAEGKLPLAQLIDQKGRAMPVSAILKEAA